MGHLTLLSLAAAKRYVRGWMRWRDDRGTKMLRLIAVTAALLAGLGACQQHGPAEPQIEVGNARGNASPSSLDSNYLLTPSGAYVLSNPPPGAEITVGSKLVRRADGGDPPAATINN
jgi:hypothetical protein